ncbi:MAG: hypothetical protein RsTaC01_0429 [Candidatus Paraimprobicoccus trichonymphae]|uniref:Uncharacterized protein n=1 Tax=Candidatus Paraimprobicoccus trichonymphae TaxID=3033793 RepID=A0AA48I471_9FIRM|nr:MAG: hypothetical protein RsTaC01_0429 [Candidatus Paraimprobicoccus trichonymphae]
MVKKFNPPDIKKENVSTEVKAQKEYAKETANKFAEKLENLINSYNINDENMEKNLYSLGKMTIINNVIQENISKIKTAGGGGGFFEWWTDSYIWRVAEVIIKILISIFYFLGWLFVNFKKN